MIRKYLLLCCIAAVAGCLFNLVVNYYSDKRIREIEDPYSYRTEPMIPGTLFPVVVAAKDIPSGATISADSIRLFASRKAGSIQVNVQIFRNVNEPIGGRAKKSIAAGEILTSENVSVDNHKSD